MNLYNLIQQDISTPLSMQECLFILKQYINIRKGIDVNPVINKNLFHVQNEVTLMHYMTTHTIIWFKNNINTIQNGQ